MRTHSIGKRLTVVVLAALLLGLAATPSMAMDKFDRIWVRDTAVGAGAGLVVGLASQNVGGWVLIGLIVGGVFGYIDAKDSIIADAEPPSPWGPSPRLYVESRPIMGREQPEQILRTTLYQARW